MEGACERTHIRMHMESGIGVRLQSARDEVAKGVLGPPPLVLVALCQLDRDFSHCPLLFAHADIADSAAPPVQSRCYSPIERMPITQTENARWATSSWTTGVPASPS